MDLFSVVYVVEKMSTPEVEIAALKEQLVQYYNANCCMKIHLDTTTMELSATRAQVIQLSQLLNSVLDSNKRAADAMKAACMMMPITMAEAQYPPN